MTPTTEQQARAERLCSFLASSPVNFFAADTVRRMLDNAGFAELKLADEWSLQHGKPYYVMVNGSAIFAFVTPQKGAAAPLRVVAAHSDSPCFRLKPHCEMETEGAVKLNTEVYGGPILYTWFDRPLSLAGRVVLRSDSPIYPGYRLLRVDRPLMVIPHLAIHFNRSVNDGNKLSAQKDMLPVAALSDENSKGLIRNIISNELDVDANDVLDYDLSLYCIDAPRIVGADSSMICAGRLDDLSMVHAATEAFLADYASRNTSGTTRVLAIFDNEETGSQTKQGAGSTVFEHIMRRMVYALGGDDNDFIRSVAAGFLVSADNAHGFHPSYPEKYDPTNHPVLGGGPCIKINARCKYMTDADSAAVFAEVCRAAGVPFQYFVNHSDSPGGSTLGNILTGSLPLRGVDMGAAVWAMHSVSETASVADHSYCIDAFTTFYGL